ncbi:hypothetical protein IA57_11110 [Mangrovimonas yunxiaonensis]|uniref:Lipoprotein n=1 Tax=Mangrovimonas yunxiaonensis TaxID=1197477 RepID=A0A084TJU1_9FLAO|nr:hypothetical protein [Mangrovimonas yunxiaonensis]KFB00977.1 hypothetical protein IA57_11110 [Mangrovimonas yunxiaonensis]GGH43241.1 hypothetical protein GCM10011364_15300 [Mangrovimonas yunxiaonensis]
MKRFKHVLAIFCALTLTFSCSSDDSDSNKNPNNNNNNNNNNGGNNYADYTISGPVLNGDFSINQTNSIETVGATGTYFSAELTGDVAVIQIILFDSQNGAKFAVVLPAETGTWNWGGGDLNSNDVFIIAPDDLGILEVDQVSTTISEIQINPSGGIAQGLQSAKGTFSGTFVLTYDNNGQEETEIHTVSGEFEFSNN